MTKIRNRRKCTQYPTQFGIFSLFSFFVTAIAQYQNQNLEVDDLTGYQELFKEIIHNQFPPSCKNSCFYSLSYEHKAGFGSRVHFMITGLAIAIENRCIFMIDFSNEWTNKSTVSPFKPLSNCTCEKNKNKRRITKRMLSETYMRYLPKLGRKKNSIAAWMTAATTFFMRLSGELESLLSRVQYDIGWKRICNGLVAGVHVRHGDKGSEANLQPFSSYLHHLSQWDYIAGAPGLRCIFLSTDDEDLLSHIKENNDRVFLQSKKKKYAVRIIRAQQYLHYADVHEIDKLIIDLFLLSRSQSLLFTFSSNFGQLAMFMKPSNLVPNFTYGELPKLIPLDFYHHVKFGHKTYGYFLTRSFSRPGEGIRWIIFPVPFHIILLKLNCDPRFEGCIYNTKFGDNGCCNLYPLSGQKAIFENLEVGPNITQIFSHETGGKM
mmetsp:Transcript_1043/g.3838  ORF Transcript_1043/g.3838 Transcript_1043/m.3838 type:complete len:434 (-) Transcript_1043:2480-3781(-)